MDPDPPFSWLGGSFGELRPDAGAGDRSIPPRADGKQCLVEDERLSIGQDPFVLRSSEPFRGLLAGLVPGIEIMVAGADTSRVLARRRLKYFRTTTLWARPSTSDPSSR